MRITENSRILLLVTGILMSLVEAASAGDPIVFVSSFAGGEQGGIHAMTLDVKAASLKPIHKTSGVENPFFIAISPDRKFLYSIYAPTFGGTEHEQVAAFQLDGHNGHLTPLNRQSTKGTASCFLEVDATGKTVLMANYSTGSVASYRIKADGSLTEAVSFVQHVGSSVNPARQKEPHAHCFIISPNNRFAYSADLGLDQIVCYTLDAATAELTPARQAFVRTPPGSGPRHLTFHPSGKYLYAINELLNTVTLFDFLPDSGMLIERQTISTLPPDYDGVTHTADLKITPDGKYLYGTNRGHDSIACYRIAVNGTLSLIEIVPSLGKGPQNLAISRSGEVLLCANMPGNNVATFRISAETGKLTASGSPIEVTGASCIRILE